MNKPYLHLLQLATLSLVMAGCSDLNSDLLSDDEPQHLTATISLAVKDGSGFVGSRAAKPTEAASYHEGEIKDALLIVYDEALSKSSPTNKRPLLVQYLSFSAASSGTYRSQQFALDLPVGGPYYYTVIANPGTLTASAVSAKNLDELYKLTLTGNLYKTGATTKDFSEFVMTSDIERSFSVTDDNVTNSVTLDITGGTPVLVERLAARIDVSFGAPAVFTGDVITTPGTVYLDATGNRVTFSSGQPSQPVASIQLPVYDYEEYQDGNLVLTGDTYTISSIQLLNLANSEYYIQRNSNGPFTDEVWQASSGYANKTVSNPANSRDGQQTYSFTSLISSGNNLFTSNSVPYYTLGYFYENSDLDSSKDVATGKTRIKVNATYHKVGDLDTSEDTSDKSFVYIFRHCLPPSSFDPTRTMAYAMVRNTIYRLCIDRVFSDKQKVYVRWYYDSTNDGEYDLITTGTPFYEYIEESDSTTPND